MEERKPAPPPPAPEKKRGEKKEKTEKTRRPTAAVPEPRPPEDEDELPEQEDLDEMDSSSAEAPPGAKRLLTCESCKAVYNVTGIEIGRKILCLRCETLMEVRDDLPVVSEADMVDLQVIDLGPSAHARELTSTKKAFRDFYEKETKRRRRPLTERTVRVSVAELRDMVDQDPSYQDRPGVAESIARSAMLAARRGKRGAGKRNPIGLLLGIGGGAIAVAALAAFLVYRSDLARGREQEKADQESETPPSQAGPRSADEVLPLGQTVVFYGLVPGDAEIFATPPVVGTTLVNRDRIQVWIQDEDLARQEIFKKILDQRNQPDGGRICLKVKARVRAVIAETPIPAGASDKVYLAVIEVEELGFDDWQATEPQIEVQGQE
ncbi:MAG: hypothetical protein HY720_31120 [Planctomycetes bacterium]|nr:hypothetical protein [Planctomycetota bacterium]